MFILGFGHWCVLRFPKYCNALRYSCTRTRMQASARTHIFVRVCAYFVCFLFLACFRTECEMLVFLIVPRVLLLLSWLLKRSAQRSYRSLLLYSCFAKVVFHDYQQGSTQIEKPLWKTSKSGKINWSKEK